MRGIPEYALQDLVQKIDMTQKIDLDNRTWVVLEDTRFFRFGLGNYFSIGILVEALMASN